MFRGQQCFGFSIRGKFVATQVALRFRQKTGKSCCHSKEDSFLVKGSGTSAPEGMIVLGCRVGAPKWIEQLASGFRAIETGGRSYRITQPNLYFNSGRGESPVCLIHDRHGYIFFRLHWEEGGRLTRMLFAHGGKAEIHPASHGGLPKETDAMVVSACGRSREMPCHRSGVAQCLHRGQ